MLTSTFGGEGKNKAMSREGMYVAELQFAAAAPSLHANKEKHTYKRTVNETQIAFEIAHYCHFILDR